MSGFFPKEYVVEGIKRDVHLPAAYPLLSLHYGIKVGISVLSLLQQDYKVGRAFREVSLEYEFQIVPEHIQYNGSCHGAWLAGERPEVVHDIQFPAVQGCTFMLADLLALMAYLDGIAVKQRHYFLAYKMIRHAVVHLLHHYCAVCPLCIPAARSFLSHV